MAKTIRFSLSQSSIERAIGKLEDYKNSLDAKMEEFVNRLLEVGIERAENTPGQSGTYGTHGFENMVAYYKQLEPNEYGCHGVMIGVGQDIEAEWFSSDGKPWNGTINTMLALEFGTAAAADAVTDMFGVTGGQGTNAQFGHEDEMAWRIIVDSREEIDKKGNVREVPITKLATAITPSRPMLMASQEMISQITTIAKEVFSQ